MDDRRPCERASSRPRHVAVLVASLALSACPPSSSYTVSATADPAEATITGTTSTGEEPLPTTSAAPDTTSTTAAPDESTTAGLPGQPKVEDAAFDPDPLQAPEPIAVTVQTEHADAVSLSVDGGPPIQLSAAGPDTFTTQLHYYSSQANGGHSAVFTPWSQGQQGPPFPEQFTVDLPPGGDEVFWEATSALGKGHVAAVAVLPGGQIAEFGTLDDGPPRCYLRRRTPAGDWTMKADVQVLPETPCKALDLGVTPEGHLYLLADREGTKDLSWWLARTESFGAPLENLRFGSPGEKAYALAMHPKRTAVCGTQPTPKADVRAAAWIYGFDAPGSTLAFDHTLQMVDQTFNETPRDCAYRDDVLVLVGDVHGQHDANNQDAPVLTRLFILESPLDGLLPTWTIDGAPEDLTQSSARAMELDSEGQIIVANYVCGSPCDTMTSELRVYKPGGALAWTMKLAPDVAPPRDLAWSPAGYIVFVSSVDLGGWSSEFFVQAWNPGEYPALWSYTKNVAPTIHEATSIAIGPFGQVYTGGMGSNGYPAVAFIHP